MSGLCLSGSTTTTQALLTTREVVTMKVSQRSPLRLKNRRRAQAMKFEEYQRRLAQQEAEAERLSAGHTGAASAARRIDPLTGAIIGELEHGRVRYRVPSVPRSEVAPGDQRALLALVRAGRDGAPASWLAGTERKGMEIGLALVRRGLAVTTRNNRFMLKKWEKKAIPPAINWDEERKRRDEEERRRTGMVEPHPLPPDQRPLTDEERDRLRERFERPVQPHESTGKVLSAAARLKLLKRAEQAEKQKRRQAFAHQIVKDCRCATA
jgi:hypothetical protein